MKPSAKVASSFLAICMTALASAPALSFAQTPLPKPEDRTDRPPRHGGGHDLNDREITSSGLSQILGEVWVDNWFKLYANGKPLLEDSVPITTERSFNAERFTFNANLPLTLAFEFRDFMENETGLEYIGSRRQQMGDGGAIAQFRNVGTGELLAVSSSNWRCLVVQSAPAQDSCVRERSPDVNAENCAQTRTPVADTWMAPDFDDSSWPQATEHSAGAVGPKDGYDKIDWNDAAHLIWGPDLKKNNVLYCRTTIGN